VRSGNQAVDPAVYEIENRALDRRGLILAAMRQLAVLSLEFPGEVSTNWLAAHPSRTSLTYGYILYSVGHEQDPAQGAQ